MENEQLVLLKNQHDLIYVQQIFFAGRDLPVIVHGFSAANPIQHVSRDGWIVNIAAHTRSSQVLEERHRESVAHRVHIDGGHERKQGLSGQHQASKALSQHGEIWVSFRLDP